MKYLPEIERILSGESLYAVAKSTGMSPETIRRELIKHPNYVKAKADGIIRQPGIPGKSKMDASEHSAAIAEVVAGGTTTAVAKKYGIPVASLNKLVHREHPDFSLQHRGKTTQQVLEAKLRKLAVAKLKAQHLVGEPAAAGDTLGGAVGGYVELDTNACARS